jgi:hypothetical protein
MLKRMTVLAMAVGMLAALALPSAASAAWGHNGADITQDVDVELTGQARFQSQLGGVECQVKSTVTFFAGQTTGAADTFVPEPTSDTTNCKGLGGLAFCQIHGVSPTQLPWTIHTAGADTISVTSGEIHSSATGGFCPVSSLTITSGTVTAQVDNPTAVSTATLSGTLVTHVGGSAQNSTISGTLHVVGGNAGTYEI